MKSAEVIVQSDPGLMGASNSLQMKSDVYNYIKGKGGKAGKLVKQSDGLVAKHHQNQQVKNTIAPKLK